MFEDYNAFMNHALTAFPNAVVDEDNDGQLIIYTGLTPTGDDDAPIVPMD